MNLSSPRIVENSGGYEFEKVYTGMGEWAEDNKWNADPVLEVVGMSRKVIRRGDFLVKEGAETQAVGDNSVGW